MGGSARSWQVQWPWRHPVAGQDSRLIKERHWQADHPGSVSGGWKRPTSVKFSFDLYICAYVCAHTHTHSHTRCLEGKLTLVPAKGPEVSFVGISQPGFYYSSNCKIYKFQKGVSCLKACIASSQVMERQIHTEHEEVIDHTLKGPKPMNN